MQHNFTPYSGCDVANRTRKCVLMSSLGPCRRGKITTEGLPYRSGSNTEAFKLIRQRLLSFHFITNQNGKYSLLCCLYFDICRLLDVSSILYSDIVKSSSVHKRQFLFISIRLLRMQRIKYRYMLPTVYRLYLMLTIA